MTPELLSPAGDMARLRLAALYGADAVYIGGRDFSMRAGCAGFTPKEMKTAADLLHAAGKKLYLTLNTIPENGEIDALPDFLCQIKDTGIDAVIAADLGVLRLLKTHLPQMEIHMSTQVGVMNYLTAAELFEMGAKRVVLARELSLDAIKTIREKTPPALELEAFVHGAMCMSVSGRCVLSQYLLGRDANRGKCAQPCRFAYHLMEEKRPGQFFPVFEDERGSYILNAKDLCMIEYIDKLAGAGIDSFKIEGRAKSEYYTAAVTGAWRRALDVFAADPAHYTCPPELTEELAKVSHRAYSTGFYFGKPDDGQYYAGGGYVHTFEIIALVEGVQKGRLVISQRNKFSVGDMLEVLTPDGRTLSFPVTEIYSEDGTKKESAPHPKERLFLAGPALPAGSILRMEK